MANTDKWGRMPWVRNNDSLVAVNPERVTTLFNLAVEHYGRKCARCEAKGNRRWVVHHRHYRTVGFEKPVEDIVLLCSKCHDDLHQRASEKLLSKDDLPFVDPQWENGLPSASALNVRIKANDDYKARIKELNTYPRWKATFIGKDGKTEITDTGLYKDEEEARRNFEAEREFCAYTSLVSFEKISD